MTDLDPLDETLELARATLAPSFADDARLRRALGLTPAGFPSPAVELRVAAPRAGVLEPRAWRALRASGSAGVLTGALLAGLGFGAGLWLSGADERSAAQPVGEPPASIERADVPVGKAMRSIPEPRAAGLRDDAASHDTTRRDDSAPRDDTARRDDIALPPEPKPLPPSSARREGRVSRHAPSRAHAASPGANDELALLRRVERALRAHNPALALALLAELQQRFPDTRLAEEREAAHVIAACGTEEGGARLRAERFLRERGGSVYAERVREACGFGEGSLQSEGSAPRGDQ
jgi:hypothetical protein